MNRGVDRLHPQARVVDEQVDAAQPRPGLLHRAGDGSLVTRIGGDARRSRQLGSGGGGALSRPARQHDRSSGPPAGAAGDEHPRAVQVNALTVRHLPTGLSGATPPD